MSREKQDDWKRTQIRIPLPFYEEIVAFSEQRNISINTAMLELMDRGIIQAESRIDLNYESTDISDTTIEKIADKVVERLNQK